MTYETTATSYASGSYGYVPAFATGSIRETDPAAYGAGARSTEATGSVPIYDAFTCALAALGSASGTSETAGSSTVYATIYALHLSLHLELLVLLPLPLVVVLVQLLHLLN